MKVLTSPGRYLNATNSVALATPKNQAVLREAIADSVHDIYRRIGGETGDRNWIDKTPDLMQTQAIPFLMELFPQARVILIHRHPEEVYVSTKENWLIKSADEKRRILERWTAVQRFYRAQIAPNVPEPRRFVIRQENLIKRRSETIGNLLAFLNVDNADQIAPRLRRFLENNQVNRTAGFEGQSYELKARSTKKERTLIKEICGQEMAYWNYSL